MRAGLQNQREHHIILTKYEALHPIVVLKNYTSSGMLTLLIKVQTVSILSNSGKFTNIISDLITYFHLDELSQPARSALKAKKITK